MFKGRVGQEDPPPVRRDRLLPGRRQRRHVQPGHPLPDPRHARQRRADRQVRRQHGADPPGHRRRRPIPPTATAITGNFTVVSPSKAGYAAVTRDATSNPPNSTINFPGGSSGPTGCSPRWTPTAGCRSCTRPAPGDEPHPARRDRLLRARDPRAAVRPAQPLADHGQPPDGGPVGCDRRIRHGGPQDPHGPGPLGRADRCRRRHRQPDRDRPDGEGLRVGNARPGCQSAHLHDQLPRRRHDGQRDPRAAQRGRHTTSFVYKATAGKTTHLILDLSGYFFSP